MEKYLIAVHFIEAAEHAYFLVDKEMYKFITCQKFNETLLTKIVSIFTEDEFESSKLKGQLESAFYDEEVLALVEAFASPEAEEYFGYICHGDVLDVLKEIKEKNIKVVADKEVFIDDDIKRREKYGYFY